MFIKRVFAILTQAVTQLDPVLEEYDRRRTTPIKVMYIAVDIILNELRHIEPELSIKLTSTSADIRSKGSCRIDADII
jgi:hypothetical protein